ncbi:hypothetical protein HYR69_02085, partial [Candidatus Sumerlaeota bacterium]|nr:hypothetical protein [Candidatus Sumerlaeota bacterium]
MSRRRHPIWKALLVMGVDICSIGLGLSFAYWFRFHSHLLDSSKGYVPENYLKILPVATGIWFLSLRLENLYRRNSKVFDFNVARRIVTGSILALLIFFAFAFYERREPQYSRMLIPIVFGSVVICLIAGRVILHLILRQLVVQKQLGLTRALILGGGEIAARVFETLKLHPEHGLAPVGVLVDPGSGNEAEAEAGLPVLGTIGDLEKVLDEQRIDEVILAQPELDRERIPTILVQCEQHLADFRIVPDTTELLFSGMIVETMNGIPFLGIRETPLHGWNAALKRLVDVVLAALLLLVSSPFMALIAWLIRRDDG